MVRQGLPYFRLSLIHAQEAVGIDQSVGKD